VPKLSVVAPKGIASRNSSAVEVILCKWCPVYNFLDIEFTKHFPSSAPESHAPFFLAYLGAVQQVFEWDRCQ
jgi:hypothetical protein